MGRNLNISLGDNGSVTLRDDGETPSVRVELDSFREMLDAIIECHTTKSDVATSPRGVFYA